MFHYGGVYMGFFNNPWFTIWVCDYRGSTIVKDRKFGNIEIYSKLWGNWVIKI